ncbi:MAG TPA: hypothetical protein VGX22_09120 [Candidatus Dormibacteraeota bacterium]|nr:hypothetical protein [Candidatus Dormibacteraeota bacterium]
MVTQNNKTRDSGAYIGAAILILIGVIALVGNLGGGKYVFEAIPLALGVAFAIAYVTTRQYGFLVPAGILSGVGAGLLLSSLLNMSDSGTLVLIGGGLGFLAIFAVDMLVPNLSVRWWPLIPGGLMLVVGASSANANQEVIRQLQIWSPLLLVGIGVVLLLTQARRRTQ